MANKKIILAAFVSVIIAHGVFADQIDDAEAASGGVPVAVIQLENANARIADLQKKLAEAQKSIADLKAQNATLTTKATATASELTALKAAMTPAQVDVSVAVKKAISDHGICNGMTLDEARQSLGVQGHLDGASGEISHYSFVTTSSFGNAKGGYQVIDSHWHVEIEGNKVVSWGID